MTQDDISKPRSDALGQGRARCRAMGMGAVGLFLARLETRAAAQPLTAAMLREEYALFCMAESEPLSRLFDAGHGGCSKGPPMKCGEAFQRTLVQRFEPLFDTPGPDGQQLSRRVVPGFLYAVTQLLGEEMFDELRIQAAAIAMNYGDAADLMADERMRTIADEALVAMAEPFHHDFPDVLRLFVEAVNGRLAAPVPGTWDQDWQLTLRLAVRLLEALYDSLHDDFQSGRVPGEHPAFQVLAAFFAGLHDARAVAGRPWLLRPLRY